MARTKNFSGPRRDNPFRSVQQTRIPNTASNAVKIPQSRKYAFFNGGSSLDWMKFKPKMEACFVENECFHYVQNNANSSTSNSVIVENKFTDAEPVEAEMVDEEIKRQLVRVNGTFNAMLGRVQGMIDSNEITRDVGRAEQMKLDNSRLVEILKIENSEHNLRDKFNAATKDWRSQKEQHVKTVGKCMGVFNLTLGDSAKSIIKDLLAVHKFRAAWIALDHHYHLGVGGQQNVAEVIHTLTSMIYDPSTPLIPHIHLMTDMVSEMNTVTSSTTNPNLVLEWIYNQLRNLLVKIMKKTSMIFAEVIKL